MTTLIILLTITAACLMFLGLIVKYYNQPKVEKYRNEREKIEMADDQQEHEQKLEKIKLRAVQREKRRQDRLKRIEKLNERWANFWNRNGK